MAKRNFPHLNDTDFPYLENEDVYTYRNTFDYRRWVPDTRVKLCNVSWCGDYDNVVKFADDAARDAWFDALSGEETLLFDTFRVLPDQSIKLPIPYDTAAIYNYLECIFPVATSSGAPIDYSDGKGVRRWFFFVDHVEEMAGGVTKLYLSLDYWTTFINRLEFPYVMLERGHAPLVATDADTYLSNPIANNDLLLTPDVSFGDLDQVKNSAVFGLNTDDVWAVFWTAAWIDNWGDINSNPGTPSTNPIIQGTTGCFAWAMDPDDVREFLDNIDNDIPQFKQTVQAFGFIQRNLVDYKNSYSFGGVTVHELTVWGRTDKTIIDLGKSDFAFDARYADYAKLYTYPYSAIEICDEKGNTSLVKVEETDGKIAMSVGVNIVFPFLHIDAYCTSVGGSAGNSLSFRTIDSFSAEFRGSWYKTILEWDIPTFAITQDATSYRKAIGFYDREQARDSANVSYSNSERSANVGYDNAERSANAGYANSERSANVGYDNAERSANAGYANSERSANVGYGNAERSANTSRINEQRSVELSKIENDNITTLNNWEAQIDTNWGGYTALRNVQSNLDNLEEISLIDDSSLYFGESYQRAGQNLSNIQTVVGTTTSLAAGAAGSIGNPGALAGVAISGVSSAINAGVSIGLGEMMTTNNIQKSYIDSTASLGSSYFANSYNYYATSEISEKNVYYAGSKNEANVKYSTVMNESNNSLRLGTANRNYNSSVTNADNSRDMQIDNAQLSRYTSITNADNTRDMQIGNAQVSRDTSITNADNSRDMQIGNAQASRDLALRGVDRKLQEQELAVPYMFGSSSNGNLATTKPMAIFCNVVTQSRSAIKRAGDEFARYGYQLGQQWEISDFNLCKHFTFWQCSEVWCAGDGNVIEGAQSVIKEILTSGVTVWRDPDEIGMVSIYDNK